MLSMPYDLRQEPWISFRRKSGIVEYLPPWQITDQIETDPIVAIAAPRPDFNGALHEFLIGLFTVALNVEDSTAWHAIQTAPPAPDELQAQLMALPSAFYLDGDGPRFLQDWSVSDFAAVKPGPVEGLLIDAAGENTQKLNKDLFIKRGRAESLGLPAAAMALLTLQTYAPSGGQGHRTSMRGGGPLTTLVDPRADGRGHDDADHRPLWQMIAANLLILKDADLPADWGSSYGQNVAARIWPWLAPTRTSREKHEIVYREDAHLLQAFFGMPRRIRLEFEDQEGLCDLLAQVSQPMVSSYKTLNFGVNYGSGFWIHPLSPHYQSKQDKLPLHPQPDGLGWKDWAGVVLDQLDGKGGKTQEVASVVRQYRDEALGQSFAVRAFGYDMDNMKARGWADATLPAWPINPEKTEVQEALSMAGSQMVEATRLVANLCMGAVLSALFARREDAKGDFSHIKADVWAAMESYFYRRIDQGVERQSIDPRDVTQAVYAKSTFQDELRTTGFDVFDTYVDLTSMDVLDAQRIVLARRDLGSALSGFGKSGNAVFAALFLPPPDKGQKARKKEAA
jgi:CRISPR system Cascade subunit CasA